MKEKTDAQKLIKSLRKANKASLFLPIFYSFVFGFVIVSVFILPAGEIKNRVLMLIVSLFVIILSWILYVFGKKNEKEQKGVIDKLEADLESENLESENDETLSEEQADIIEEKVNVIKNKILIIIRFEIYLIICFLFLGLLLIFHNTLDLPQWVLFTLLATLVSGILFFSIDLIIKYYQLYNYSKQNFKE